MNIVESSKTCIQKFTDFNSRASRSEFWWFFLVTAIISYVVASAVYNGMLPGFVSGIFSLALFIPSVAVTIRRLHDTNHSGYFFFLFIIPVIGGLIVLYNLAKKGDSAANKYGEIPAE